MTQIVRKNIKVLVTGVTGYVGAHVAQQLLLHGYTVRGTVRNASDETRINKVKEQITHGLPTDGLPELEFVEADLLKDECWPQAVAGCEFVCHVASPFPLEIPTDPDVLIKPALDGTLSVLKAAAADGNVKRVALTSSLAAIYDPKVIEAGPDPEKKYNEDNWIDENKVEAYSKSKIMAEKAARKFVDDLPCESGKSKLELVVINPALVLGPLLTDSLSSSVLSMKRLLDKSIPAVPKLQLPICDVRDVALAHVKALDGPEYVGKRYLIFTDSKWMKDIARVVQKEFKPLGYFVPTFTVPSTLVSLMSYLDKSLAIVVPRLDREYKLDNNRMVEELKITPVDIDKTILDTCHSLIEKGIVKPTRKYNKSKQVETEAQTAGEVASGDTAQQPDVVKAES